MPIAVLASSATAGVAAGGALISMTECIAVGQKWRIAFLTGVSQR